MKTHVKNYLKAYGYGEQDVILCEVCGKQAVDLHHIEYLSRGGTNDAENIIALCRECHEKAHREEYKVDYLKQIHNEKYR